MNRRAFLASTAALAAMPAYAAPPSLRQAAASRGLLYGTAAATGQLRDADFVDTLVREAAILVPEYEMKRGLIEARRGNCDFSGMDTLAGFARAKGLKLRGHPLVWHKRNPDWIDDVREDELTGYITALMTRYRLHSWDVVNEAIDTRAPGNLRETVWLKRFGPSYIDLAFHTARAADPSTMLVYNDWGCELGAPENDRFRAATLDFLEGLRKRAVPIDALGMQGHLGLSGAQVDQAKLRVFVERVAALGLKILVTEHDVDDDGGPSDPSARDRMVADASRRFLDVMLDNRATVAVLTWGLTDRYLDAPGWKQKLSGWTPRRLPLDAGLAKTAMWDAIRSAFQKVELRK